jgi:hypothetical protein
MIYSFTPFGTCFGFCPLGSDFGPLFFSPFVGYFDYWCLPAFHYGHFPMLLTFKKFTYFEKNNH